MGNYSVPSSVKGASILVCAIPFGYAAALFLLLALIFGILAICKRKKGICVTGIVMAVLAIVNTLLWKFLPIRFLGVSVNDLADSTQTLTIIVIVFSVFGVLALVLSILGLALRKNKAPAAPNFAAPVAPAQPFPQSPIPQKTYVQMPAQPAQPFVPQQPVYQPSAPQQPLMNLSPEKAAELKKLDDMLSNHVISREEYEATKKWLLG